MSRRSVTLRDLSNTGSPAGFPKTRAKKRRGMLRIKSAMLSLCLCECGPHSPIATYARAQLKTLSSLLKDVRAHCYCASLQRTQIHMPRHASSAHALSTKMNNDGQMAIATALLGFSDLGCSVTPTFLFKNRFYLQLSPHCPKMNKKSMWEVKISVLGTLNPAILRPQGT